MILENLEDNRACTNLLSIDFEKAFNRMDHRICVEELRKKGASSGLIAMISSFLHGRSKTVKIGEAQSHPRPVPGGSPQGSILANYLFCITTDNLAEQTNEANLLPHSPPRPTLPIGTEARAASTPLGIGRPLPGSPGTDDDDTLHDESIRFFRNRNVPEFLNSSEEEEESYIMLQDQIDEIIGIPDRWRHTPIETLCYIDDFNCVEKVRLADCVSHITQAKRKCLVHAIQSEGLFLQVKRKSEEKNMKINEKKTQLLCVTASPDDIRSYITVQGRRTLSSDTLKVLGFTFGRTPTPQAHINVLLSRLRRKLWILTKLRRTGMRQKSLVTIYFSAIRSIAEFGCVAFHSLLNARQSACLEDIQRRALKNIFGYDKSYRSILDNQEIPTMHQRRETLLLKFARKCANSERFKKWFPLKPDTGHRTRNNTKYLEFTARTERLSKSPLYEMRRLLNKEE